MTTFTIELEHTCDVAEPEEGYEGTLALDLYTDGASVYGDWDCPKCKAPCTYTAPLEDYMQDQYDI